MYSSRNIISNLFVVSVAICDLPLTLTSRSNRTIPVVLTDPKNIGKTVGNSVLFVYKLIYTYLKFRVRHHGYTTSSFYQSGHTTLPLFLRDSWTPKNIGTTWFVVKTAVTQMSVLSPVLRTKYRNQQLVKWCMKTIPLVPSQIPTTSAWWHAPQLSSSNQ